MTQVQTFEDFPVTFVHHETIPYISHRSLAEYFKWPRTTRKRKFMNIAQPHPEMVAYFQCGPSREVQKLHHPFTSTEEFMTMTKAGLITRCLTKQGLILTLMKENKHARAKEFQKFGCAVLDSYMTHGEVGRQEASSLVELTAKINAENDTKRLENEKFRLELEKQRMDFEQKKLESAEMLAEREKLEKENYQLANLGAWSCILNAKRLAGTILTSSQKSKMNTFVRTLVIKKRVKWIRRPEWRKSKPFFVSREALQESMPDIGRLNLRIGRRQNLMYYAKKQGKCLL